LFFIFQFAGLQGVQPLHVCLFGSSRFL
jgi:hypothetical protein